MLSSDLGIPISKKENEFRKKSFGFDIFNGIYFILQNSFTSK